jgi:hypothetical protein
MDQTLCRRHVTAFLSYLACPTIQLSRARLFSLWFLNGSGPRFAPQARKMTSIPFIVNGEGCTLRPMPQLERHHSSFNPIVATPEINAVDAYSVPLVWKNQ